MLPDTAGIKDLDLSREEWLHIVADYTYDWEYWQLPNGTFAYMSPSCRRITGFEPEAFNRDPGLYYKIIHPEDLQKFKAHKCEPLEKEVSGLEFRIITAEGKVAWIEHLCYRLHDRNGHFIGCRASNRDITDRKQTEDALRRAQSVAKVGNWLMNVKTNQLIWSNETYRIFGVEPQTSLNYEYFLGIVHPEDRALVDEAWKKALASRTDYKVQHRIVADGKVKWIQEVSELEFDKDGTLLGAFGTAQDITQQKETEDELLQRTAEAEESQRLLDAIMEYVPVGITVIDAPDATIRLMSRFGACLLNECTREYFERTTSWSEWKLMFSNGMPVAIDQMPLYRAMYKNETIESEEYLVPLADTTVHLLISAGPIRNSHGNIIAAIALWQDITGLKEAESRLRQRTAEAEEAARLLDMIMEHVPVGILVAEAPDIRIRLMSRFGASLLDAAQRSDFEGTLVSNQREMLTFVKSAVEEKGLLPLTEAVQKGRIVENQEFVLNLSEEKRLHLLVSAGPIRDARDEIMGGILVWQDITELKKAEQSLQESRRNLLELKEQLENKNKELESIIGVVSHDLRSPLVSISGFSHEIKLSSQNAGQAVRSAGTSPEELKNVQRILDEEIPEFINYIQSSTSRMDTLVKSLVKVARAGMAEIRPEPLNMNELFSEASASMGFELKESGAELVVDDLPECIADKNQASQIFANLLDNAVKYLDPNRRGRIHVFGYAEENRSVYCVQDNGIGIAAEFLDRIFDLFSRLDQTKVSGEGIGLAMVKRLTERNNGVIWVESEVGKGTRFCVALPRTERS